MTRVDFHFNTPDKLSYACRLVRKVVRSGHRVVVWSAEAGDLDAFDRALWAFSPTEFVPHVHCDDPLASRTPVLLAQADIEPAHHEVMVNLGQQTPPLFGRFERLIELVATDENDRAAARERWRFYRDRGYPMTRHDLAHGRE